MRLHRSHLGFTIVELLIVIVVIAVLATITVVAYNGIQQRANNTAIIDAASKSLRMIQSYIATTSSYPATGGLCITTGSGCVNGSGTTFYANATFNTNIATVGTLSRSIPTSGTDRYGIIYFYDASMTYLGAAAPLHLHYYLNGTNQQCGLPLVQTNSYPNFTASATGYSTGNDSGKTLCYITVPGPAS